jgi:hypothetical protein
VQKSKPFPEQIYQDCEKNTENDEGGYGKIDPAVFFFNPDIARKSSDPVHLIME